MATTSPTQSEVLSKRAEGVLTLTLNRPDTLNSLTADVLDAIRAGVESASEDPEVRCIVLAGAGRAFSSGASLRDERTFDPEPLLLAHYNPTIMAMQKVEKPILASIHGIAAGAGASLTLACDF